MQAARAALPELDTLGRNSITAPHGRTRDITMTESRTYLGDAAFELVAPGNHGALA